MATRVPIYIDGDVGTYKAVVCQAVKKALASLNLECDVSIGFDVKAYNVFLTTPKGEARNTNNTSKLNQYDLVVDIKEVTGEEVIEIIIEMYIKSDC